MGDGGFSAKELFSKLQERYLKLDETSLPSSHPSVQEELTSLAETLGDVWRDAERESLFSDNEMLNEVETSSLPFVFFFFFFFFLFLLYLFVVCVDVYVLCWMVG